MGNFKEKMHVFVHKNTKTGPVYDLEPQCLAAVLRAGGTYHISIILVGNKHWKTRQEERKRSA